MCRGLASGVEPLQLVHCEQLAHAEESTILCELVGAVSRLLLGDIQHVAAHGYFARRGRATVPPSLSRTWLVPLLLILEIVLEKRHDVEANHAPRVSKQDGETHPNKSF
jgi:hypothetical protein